LRASAAVEASKHNVETPGGSLQGTIIANGPEVRASVNRPIAIATCSAAANGGHHAVAAQLCWR
ncbi:MAG TPA: hypothetical protein VNX87_20170, partial [Candidatus Sulfotelmatobacter sp.]|nr:hypothetical protein [Candidatus Sulfotelmatobacter sp.]